MKDETVLAIAKANPGLACALMAAARGQALITLHCPFDGSKIYVKPDRVEAITPADRNRTRLTFTNDPSNRHALMVVESPKTVRAMCN